MYDSRPEELIHAEKLMYSGKLEETLEIINNFEKIHNLSKKEQLRSLLLRGWISVFQVQFDLAIENGFMAYQMSQDLELVSESIEALTLKSFMVFFEKVKEASKNLSDAQNLLDSKELISFY